MRGFGGGQPGRVGGPAVEVQGREQLPPGGIVGQRLQQARRRSLQRGKPGRQRAMATAAQGPQARLRRAATAPPRHASASPPRRHGDLEAAQCRRVAGLGLQPIEQRIAARRRARRRAAVPSGARRRGWWTASSRSRRAARPRHARAGRGCGAPPAGPVRSVPRACGRRRALRAPPARPPGASSSRPSQRRRRGARQARHGVEGRGRPAGRRRATAPAIAASPAAAASRHRRAHRGRPPARAIQAAGRQLPQHVGGRRVGRRRPLERDAGQPALAGAGPGHGRQWPRARPPSTPRAAAGARSCAAAQQAPARCRPAPQPPASKPPGSRRAQAAPAGLAAQQRRGAAGRSVVGSTVICAGRRGRGGRQRRRQRARGLDARLPAAEAREGRARRRQQAGIRQQHDGVAQAHALRCAATAAACVGHGGPEAAVDRRAWSRPVAALSGCIEEAPRAGAAGTRGLVSESLCPAPSTAQGNEDAHHEQRTDQACLRRVVRKRRPEVRQAGAGGLLGRVVRALQDDRADPRRGVEGLRRTSCRSPR